MRRTIIVIAAALSLCTCARHIMIRPRPDQDPGAFGPIKRCAPGEQPCTDDPTFDTSRFSNTGGATFFSWPTCAFGINAVLVDHAESSSPTVYATCNQPPQQPPSPDGGIPTTSTSATVAH